MENAMRHPSGFVGYEYKEVETEPGQASFFIDGYENFGWELDENVMPHGLEKYPEKKSSGHGKTILRFKRNRKIINKAELTRLQRNFEACAAQIRMMEKEKTSRPAVLAITVGILGTAFMAGATFAVTASPPHIILCIVLAVPGFLGWLLPYFLYRRSVRRQTEKLTPLIEAKYDEIYEICEKGSRLL